MDKDALLVRLAANTQALANALANVPPQMIEEPGVIGERSIKEVCALLTAWDGEALRRIDITTGKQSTPTQPLNDGQYWAGWAEKQIAIKCVMPVQGILVDLIGTRQRLLSRVAELNQFQIERWFDFDPQATQPHFDQYLAQILAWRAGWDETNPTPTRLKKWWQGLKQRLRTGQSH